MRCPKEVYIDNEKRTRYYINCANSLFYFTPLKLLGVIVEKSKFAVCMKVRFGTEEFTNGNEI